MSEERVGDNFGGPGLDSRPKVGDDRVSAAIEESDRKESDKRYDKAKERFYSSLGMKPPKEGEPDAIMSGGDYLPGQAPVTLPEKSKKAEKPAKSAKSEREEKRDRKSQPPLRQAEPESEEIEEEPADEAEPVDADDVQEDVEADAEEETTDEDVSSESEEKEEESDDEDSSSDLDEETTILRRAQIPMSVIKKMTRAESRRMAEIERVRQAHADDLGRQLGEAKKKESGDKPSAESGSVTPPEQPAKRTSVEPLLGILGDDAAPALTEYDKTIDDRVDSLRKELSAVYLDDLLDDARSELAEQFPELGNDRFFKSIREEMSVLGQSKFTKLDGLTKRAKIQSLMERAVTAARQSKGLKVGRGDKAPAAPARKHGTVSPLKRTSTAPKVGTTDRSQKSWDMLMQGMAPKEVRRRLDSRS